MCIRDRDKAETGGKSGDKQHQKHMAELERQNAEVTAKLERQSLAMVDLELWKERHEQDRKMETDAAMGERRTLQQQLKDAVDGVERLTHERDEHQCEVEQLLSLIHI
eukprot:TRINITY_DN29627_c0_g1_i1.p1 TRINITY_DN29627_c0_g1~~TRINITY_DN29627_c0_g1_i1.p1  ORF type:complete len:108 (+),score=46.52 TRINITY_DN29627_c0_g1_i1:104-427(+)